MLTLNKPEIKTIKQKNKQQKFLDDITPFQTARWIGALVFILLFIIRIKILQGWYIIMYVLSIYHLILFIEFLTPKINLATEESEDDSGPSLPTRANEEFRPFIRRLPEFKFWYLTIKSTLLSIFLTFFQLLNLPISRHILGLYFFVIFCLTMKRQIMVRNIFRKTNYIKLQIIYQFNSILLCKMSLYNTINRMTDCTTLFDIIL